MKKKFLIPLIINVILLGVSLFILYDYDNFKKVKMDDNTTNSIVNVDHDLSINLLDGKLITGNNEVKTHFSVTNTSDNTVYYYINFIDTKFQNETLTYDLISTDFGVNKDHEVLNIGNNIIDSFIKIDAKTTHSYDLKISDCKDLSLTINIGYEEFKEQTLNQIIMANNTVKDPLTKPGVEVATTDEGLIKDIDSDGITYYFRGNVTNNYVSLNDDIYRIVRINGDGTIRLIYNDSYVVNSYYDSMKDQNVSYTSSKVQLTLNDFLTNNLGDKQKYLVDSNFCSDESVQSTNNGYTYYAGNNRSLVDMTPSFKCGSTEVRSRVGLISADEVLFAGGANNKNNYDYYLYNKNFQTGYYTMTPAYQRQGLYANIISVNRYGSVNNETLGTNDLNIRPVIILKSNLKASGTGTGTDPYIIIE